MCVSVSVQDMAMLLRELCVPDMFAGDYDGTHVMSCPIMLLSCHALSFVMSCLVFFMLSHAMSCHVMSCHIMLHVLVIPLPFDEKEYNNNK